MSHDDGLGRSQYYGAMWLNAVFVNRQAPFRLHKRLSTRLYPVEVVLIILMIVLSALVIFALLTPLSYVPGLDKLIEPVLLAALASPFLGWTLGRRLAKASPYRRSTGESLAEYIYVQSDSKSYLLGKIVGRTVAVNKYITRISGKPLPVDAVEWLGSARAPEAPRRPDPADDDGRMDLYLVPRSRPTNWVKESRRSRNRHRAPH